MKTKYEIGQKVIYYDNCYESIEEVTIENVNISKDGIVSYFFYIDYDNLTEEKEALLYPMIDNDKFNKINKEFQELIEKQEEERRAILTELMNKEKNEAI